MNKIFVLFAAFALLLISCKEDWEEHYNSAPETVDQDMWDIIKADENLSKFVEYVESLEYDTLFREGTTFTLFLPNNDAVDAYLVDDSITATVLDYHISLHFIQSGNISGADKIQTLAEKFVPFERFNNTSLYDGIPLEFESPLYRNGKFFVMGSVAKPKPNLFEYYAINNPILKSYILDLDSIVLDKEKSRPIGFDDNGNTIYDSITTLYNEFEEEYFPIREEFRFKTATMVFPRADDYNSALDVMAASLGDLYQSYADIPESWQKETLIPYLLERGVFENSLSEIEFIKTGGQKDTLKLKNILGDSIAIEYEVADKAICSNGLTYNYKNFEIPDTLFRGSVRIEAEWYVEEIGINKFAWREELTTVNADKFFDTNADSIPSASNDSIVRVQFDAGYTGRYDVEFVIDNLFPRKYLMVVRSHKNFGGIYDIYFNDVLIRTMDYDDYFSQDFRWFYESVTGARIFYDTKTPGYVHWDAWADNVNPYGEATLRFEYKGPGEVVPNEALLIDYIDFIPYDD